jgi:hypothetical protein
MSFRILGTVLLGTRSALVLGALSSALLGCGAEGLDDQGFDDSGMDEPLGQTEEAIGATFDVGVLTLNATCPVGVPFSRIYLDGEDDNRHFRLNPDADGLGVNHLEGGVAFTICRVDGRKFRAKITGGVSQEYAVFQMGSQCPTDSFPFSKYMDTEDDDNRNSVTGDIQPSAVDRNARFRFCLFRTRASLLAMSAWPSLGFEYSVFSRPVGSEQFGFLGQDDEDDDNENSYSVAADWATSAKLLVSGGRNTTYSVLRAR